MLPYYSTGQMQNIPWFSCHQVIKLVRSSSIIPHMDVHSWIYSDVYSRILIVCYRSNCYNCVVIATRIMQVIRLFSSFAVLSTDIDLISVTLICVENKADNAIDCQKYKARNSEFWLYIIVQISITAWFLQLESCKLNEYLRHSLCCRLI